MNKERNRLLKILFKDIRKRFGGKSLFLVLIMIINGLMEGVGMVLLIPLLKYIGITSTDRQGAIDGYIDNAYNFLNIDPSAAVILFSIVSVFFVQNLIFILQSYYAANMQHEYMSSWRNELLSSFLRAEWTFLVKSKTGELINTLIGETNRVGGLFYLVSQLLAITFIAFIYLILALTISWQVTLMILITSIILMIATRGIVRWGYRIGNEITDSTNDLQIMANEFISGGKVIKATSTEKVAEKKFGETVNKIKGLYFWSSLQPNLIRSIFEFTGIVLLCTILVIGATSLNINSAEILIIIALFVRLFPRLTGVQQNMQLLNVYLPAINITTRLRNNAAQLREEAEHMELPEEISGKPVGIQAENLTLCYGENQILDDVSISVPAGKTVAIVGTSGAGKSTLVDCLLNLVKPNTGKIYINGINLNDIDLYSWRRNVGYVAQDTFLFHASVMDNLLWATDVNNTDAAYQAATISHADDFIRNFTNGYDTVVGERGVRLSGGQKQRIGIARALVNNPSLLIFDEATSALDAESEKSVLDVVRELHGKMTIVMIAHRYGTVRNADLIYVMDNGRIIESGTWDELISNEQGKFSAMWKLQNS